MAGREQVQEVVGYNLDVVISVGYRVHSLRGVEFRRWATSVLKEYVLRGYAFMARLFYSLKAVSGRMLFDINMPQTWFVAEAPFTHPTEI